MKCSESKTYNLTLISNLKVPSNKVQFKENNKMGNRKRG